MNVKVNVSVLSHDSHYLDPSVAHLPIRIMGAWAQDSASGSIWMAENTLSIGLIFLEILPTRLLAGQLCSGMFLGSISQGALAYLLRIRDHFSDNGISTERSRSGKANGRHKYAWIFFFFKKKYSTVIPTKNLSEIKSGVRTIGERIQKTQLVMGLWVETGCLSLLFSILSSCFPLAPSSFCSSSYSFSSSFPPLPFLLFLLSLPLLLLFLLLLICFHFLLFLLFPLLLLLPFSLPFSLSLVCRN